MIVLPKPCFSPVVVVFSDSSSCYVIADLFRILAKGLQAGYDVLKQVHVSLELTHMGWSTGQQRYRDGQPDVASVTHAWLGGIPNRG